MWEALRILISQVIPCAGKEDVWSWKSGKDDVFSTKAAYDIIAASNYGLPPVEEVEAAKVWKARAPHKATVSAWRALINRLSTCDNLLRRNVYLGVEERWCNSCVMQDETAEHIFLHCPKVEMVWNQIHQWIDVKTAKPKGILQHFKSFVLGVRRKEGRKLLLALWVGIIWLIWMYRNESRFEGRVWDANQLVLEMKGRLWSWNKIFHLVDENGSFSSWCSSEHKLSFL
ncbi:uncharacterized protein LOC131021145 [Salvia miltiorrhiza]|uniref:uncharacterized protein LOC131021145 n=1 Tax=Salvia miltiorrhiza TaxID=226208 RepID=UPI0025ABBB9C|nr:uncharacterized protein LOC131021145 [Salvia miltiorrhiza]